MTARIRGGKVSRFAVSAPGLDIAAVQQLCSVASVGYDDKLERLTNTMSVEGIDRVEYGRAGEHAGVDVYIEPTEAAPKGAKPATEAAVN